MKIKGALWRLCVLLASVMLLTVACEDDESGVDLGGGTVNGKDIYDLPNCYIVKPSSEFTFPVAKAYLAWKSQPELGNITLSGDVTTELLWQDAPTGAVISKVELSNGDEGAESKIKVYTGDKEGNGLVVVKVNDTIRWSWHIWVTDYEPTGNWMDRNLGATTNEAGNIGSYGLFYQWGRKDPFAAIWTYDHNTEEEYGKPLFIGYSNLRYKVSTKKEDTICNLGNSIVNPDSYYGTIGGAWQYIDWYSNDSTYRNDYLWLTEDGKKSIYDPSPEGWQVPKVGAWDNTNWSEWYSDEMGYYTSSAGGWYPTKAKAWKDDSYGYYWTSKPVLDTVFCMDGHCSTAYVVRALVLNNRSVKLNGYADYGSKCFVRCIKE